MKKFIYNLFAITAFTLFLTSFASCGGGGSNTPSDKALEIMGYLQDEDYESYAAEFHNAKQGSNQELKEFTLMLEMKGSKTLDKKNGIESYEVIDEQISEDGNTATIKMKITYGNGEVEEDKIKMIKDSSGDWKNKLM